MRFSIFCSTLVLIMCVALMLPVVSCVPHSEPVELSHKNLMTVCASVTGEMVFDGQWYLSVNADGFAVLSVFHSKVPDTRRFVVDKEQMDRLRSLILALDSNEANSKYGSPAPDGSETRIVVFLIDKTISLTIFEIDDVLETDEKKIRSFRHTLMIEREIESWLPRDAHGANKGDGGS